MSVGMDWWEQTKIEPRAPVLTLASMMEAAEKMRRVAALMAEPEFTDILCLREMHDRLLKEIHVAKDETLNRFYGIPVYVFDDRWEMVVKCLELREGGRRPMVLECEDAKNQDPPKPPPMVGLALADSDEPDRVGSKSGPEAGGADTG